MSYKDRPIKLWYVYKDGPIKLCEMFRPVKLYDMFIKIGQ
jgi:hypothetical protein